MSSVQIDRTPKDLPPHLHHASSSAYQKYHCRCHECCAWQSNYASQRNMRIGATRSTKGWRGESVTVDGERIARLIDNSGRSIEEFCSDVEVPPTTLKRVIQTGRVRVATLDIIACGLGCHMSQLTIE